MVAGISRGFELYKAYEELEEMIKETKWYEFAWRSRLRKTLSTLRYIGAIKGFESGIQDLVDAGILHENK